jgi:hypothetical protein
MVKLAFWNTIGETYRFIFTRPLVVLRAGWVMLTLGFAQGFVDYEYGAFAEYEHGTGNHLISVILQMAAAISTIPAEVAIERAILLEESSWIVALQFRYRHWRQVGISVLMLLMVVPPAVIIVISNSIAYHYGLPVAAKAIIIVVSFFALLGLGLAFTRLQLAMPAIAIDDPAKAIRAAWRRGQSNSWRVFGGVVIITLSILLAFLLVFGLQEGLVRLNVSMSQLIIVVLLEIFQFAGTMISISYFAFAYKQLAANWNPPPVIEAQQPS